MSRRVLITGGAGFIGFHLASHLVSRGYRVCLVDNCVRGIVDRELKKLLLRSEVILTKVDLLDRDAVRALGTDFDSIFHLGAIIGVQNVLKRPFKVLAENTRMLDNVIALARQQLNLSRLLFVPSACE